MPDLPAAPRPGTYIGFDYGEKRIGIAVGNTVTASVTALCFVANRSGTPDWPAIETILSQWQPVGAVVGEPLTMTGAAQAVTHHARGFARRLQRRAGIPVYLEDETQSTLEAYDVLRQQQRSGLRTRTRKQDTDKIAAALILQRWLDERNQSG